MQALFRTMACVALCLLLSAWEGFAAEAAGNATRAAGGGNQTEHKMQSMVVTATRTEIEADKAPASVTIVTRQEMERKNIRTVDDALKNVSGVSVKRTRGIHEPPSTTSVTMRGLSAQSRTLILVDGIPFNDGYSALAPWGAIPTDAVERIEVIRGPGSALYGGNAMGGVINIIMRVPQKTEAMARGGIGAGQSNTPGSHNVYANYKYGAGAGTRLGDQLSLYAGYEGESTTGYPATLVVPQASTTGVGAVRGGFPMETSGVRPGWVVGNNGNSFGDREALSALAAWDATETGKLRLDFLWGRNYYDYGPPNTYIGRFTAASVQAWPGFRTGAVSASSFYSGLGETQDYRIGLSYDDTFFDKLHVKTSLTYQPEHSMFTQASTSNLPYDLAPGSVTNSDRDSWMASIQADYPLFTGNTLTFGGDFRHNSFNLFTDSVAFFREPRSKTTPQDRTRGKSNAYAVFLEDTWELPWRVTLYNGARLDFWETFDAKSGSIPRIMPIQSHSASHLSPRFSVVWNPLDDTYIRASAANGFRTPTLYEMLRSWTSGTTLYQANADLKPETLWSEEIGVTQYFWDKRVKLGATVFHTDFRDYISSVTTGDTTRQQQNIGRLEVNGLEFEASVKPWDFLTLWGNVSFNEPKVVSYTPPLAQWFLKYQYENKYLTDVPLTQANLGLDAEYKDFKLGFSGNYAGRTYNRNDNADPQDVYGGYSKRWLWDSKLTYSPTKYTDVSLSVNNIFDKQYYQSYAGAGRTFMVEVKVKF